MEHVCILGASTNEERYSNRAQKMLIEHGNEVYPVNPAIEMIDGVRCFHSIADIDAKIDTVTLYLGPKHLKTVVEDLIVLNPRRVIFNPGTEDADCIKSITDAGIETVIACTLVMLATNQF